VQCEVFISSLFIFIQWNVTSDNRDWGKYNDALVRRGEILLDFSTINNWKQELKQLNKGKVGEPYHYPNSLIMLLGLIESSTTYHTDN